MRLFLGIVIRFRVERSGPSDLPRGPPPLPPPPGGLESVLSSKQRKMSLEYSIPGMNSFPRVVVLLRFLCFVDLFILLTRFLPVES